MQFLCDILCFLVIRHSTICLYISYNFVISYNYRFCSDTPDEEIIPVSALEICFKTVVSPNLMLIVSRIFSCIIFSRMWMKKASLLGLKHLR